MNKPKKILIIGLTERMGGVETFIYNITKFSNSNEYNYEYLIHGADHCVYQDEILDFYNDNECIHFISKFKRNPFKTIKELYQFYKKNASKYDYIHLQTGATSEVMYVFPFNFIFGLPVISHSHNGNGYSPIVNNLFRPLLNLVSSKRLSCSDEATKWLFGSKHLRDTKLINNGIDTRRFSFNFDNRRRIRQRYRIADDTLLIGHIGRFSEQKNHEKIIEIFQKVLDKKPNSKLLLIGVGERKADIKTLVKNQNLSDDVIFAGKQMETEAFYSAFDVFLMPSLYEGLPIVGIEAQSMGLPCFFATTIDSKIVLTDRTKLLSLDSSSDIWAEQILAVDFSIERTKYPKIIDDKGFSIKSTVSKLEEIYEVK